MLRRWCRKDWRFRHRVSEHVQICVAFRFLYRESWIYRLFAYPSVGPLLANSSHAVRKSFGYVCLSTACSNLCTDKHRRNSSEEGRESMHYPVNILRLSRETFIAELFLNVSRLIRPTYNPAFFISCIVTSSVIYRNGAPFLRWDEALISVAILSQFSFYVLSFHCCSLAARYWLWTVSNMFLQWVRICVKKERK